MRISISHSLKMIVALLGLAQCMEAATIQVRVLNAKNGKRVPNEKVSVLVKGEKGARDYVTDADGNFNLDIDPAAEISVETEWWVTCHVIPTTTLPYISVDRILKDGFTDKNICGHAKSEPIRGQLIIFARKATFAENFSR